MPMDSQNGAVSGKGKTSIRVLLHALPWEIIGLVCLHVYRRIGRECPENPMDGENMKRRHLAVICLLFASTASGQIRFAEQPGLDGWSVAHFGGGASLYAGCRILHVGVKTSLALTALAGVAWELVIDGAGNKLPLFDKPDPAGADLFGDAVMVAAGAGFACLLDLLMQLVNQRLAITANGRTVGVAIPIGK